MKQHETLNEPDYKAKKSLYEVYVDLYSKRLLEFVWTGHPEKRAVATQKIDDLIEKGADVNYRDKGARTPLMWALRRGEHVKEYVPALLERGADVKAVDCFGKTALEYALMYDAEVVQAIIEHGADVNRQDKRGVTPLMDAVSNGYTDSIEILLKAGADVNLKDNEGKTALMMASERGDVKAVNLLIGKTKSNPALQKKMTQFRSERN